jgi:hypothetical protein
LNRPKATKCSVYHTIRLTAMVLGRKDEKKIEEVLGEH